MFDPTDEVAADPAKMKTAQTIDPDGQSNAKPDEEARKRHKTLMQALDDEGELQAEERMQMAIDHDYDDHLHWREEDAMTLIERGQAPLVFNEGRQTREWITGMQKRMRIEGNILPREPNDEQSAEVKGKVFKYVSDANLAQWHVSAAFKECVIGGLGWLEEGISTDPGTEQIFAGHESWRNVIRDSRAVEFDLKDGRYLFRKKRVDLDYAIALLPHARDHLRQQSDIDPEADQRLDDPWYLGERLTSSTDMTGLYDRLPSSQRGRGAYIGGDRAQDYGRRMSTELIEAWYRVPQSVEVFSAGPLKGKEYDQKNEGHQQLERDRWRLYKAVAMRMRVMIATKSAPLWDGASPLRHQKFTLIPVWGYRRGRDGQCYGIWRGMRDINDDINKRASKALQSASSNRVLYETGVFPDPEIARTEAARPDMFLEVAKLDRVRFEKPTADMQMNLELLTFNQGMLRNIGGVTDANLGRPSRAESGKAIGLQQDQGALTTSELPDNLRLALQIASRLRLSHIEQFMTEQQVVRIVGEGQPIEWLKINEPQPDGSVLNDIAASEADYIIAERDYRESYAKAALESMMELLGQVGTFAPEIVLAVLDLVVENAEIQNKAEWVARIRAVNGQRDPTKAPTPQDQQKKQQADQQDAKAKQIQMDTMQAGLDKLRAEVQKLDVEAMLKRVESMFSALQAAQTVALQPGVAPVGDEIMRGAGFEDQGGQDPNIPQPDPTVDPAAGMVPPEQGIPGEVDPGVDPGPLVADPGLPQDPQQLEGVQGGIETMTPADNGPAV